jgi:exportin-T
VQLVLAETVSITLAVLEALPENDEVRSKTLVLLQRMILCIQAQVLPTMPRFLLLLIQHCTTDDIQDVAQLLNQLSIKFGTEAIGALDPVIVPFLRKCHELVPSTGEVVATNDIPPHLQTEQLSIKKLTFTVMQHVATYRLSPVLLSPTNAGSLELVLQTMSEAAIHVEDSVVKKACTTFFRELVDQWINDGRSNEAICSVRAGFLHFVLQVYIPGMLQCMLGPVFDHEDALQARNVNEFANTLFILKSRVPADEFEQNVIRGALASSGCPPQVLDAFGQVTSQQEMELCLRETLKVLKQAQVISSSR